MAYAVFLCVCVFGLKGCVLSRKVSLKVINIINICVVAAIFNNIVFFFIIMNVVILSVKLTLFSRLIQIV